MNFFLRAIRFTLAKVQPMLPSDVTIASYVDDICVASNSRDSHVKALRILFSALEMDGWTANIGKCKFLQQSVLFLGVNYSRGGTAPDPALLTKLRNLPPPKSTSDLRSFFGLGLCLQDFNYRLEHTLAPLRRFLKSKQDMFESVEFLSQWKACVDTLQDQIWTLTPWEKNSSLPMSVYVDSSSVAHGAALFQGENLIAMWSILNRRPHASSADSEITGLRKALDAFKPFLVGNKFTVYTDNKAVFSALNPANQSDVIKRHLDSIQFWFGSTCNIEHVAGASHSLADLLSRSTYLASRTGQTPKLCLPIVPRPSQEEISFRLRHAHFGHWSYEVTLQNVIMEFGRWPGVESDVRAYIQRCPNCAFSGAPQVRDVPSTEVSTFMGQKVHMDHAGPYFDGSHVLVIVDDATKHVTAVQTPGTGARHAIRALEDWINRWGQISMLCVDNASGWNSLAFLDWTDRHGIELRRAPSYYHKGNSLAERTIQTLLHRMRRMMNGSPAHWPWVIEYAVLAMNTSWHSSIGTSPQVLVEGVGRNGVLLSEEARANAWNRALAKQQKSKEYELKRFNWKHPRKSPPFRTHDRVLMLDPLFAQHQLRKLAPTWQGPYYLIRRHSNSVWVLSERLNNAPLFLAHSSQLKLFFG